MRVTATTHNVSANLSQLAASYATKGWRLFPLRPGDKRPALHGEKNCPGTGACANGHQGWEQRATADVERVRAAWAGPYRGHNIGIACGPSRLVVLDLDTSAHGGELPDEWRLPGVVDGSDVLAVLAERAGQPWPATRTHRTPSGGWHLLFRAPEHGPEIRSSQGRLGPRIDVRAAGGYIVAPGSTVGGRPYTVIDDREPAPLPAWLADLLTRRDPERAGTYQARALATTARAPASRRYVAAAVRAELERVAAARPGTRNSTLNKAAFALGQFVGAGLLDERDTFDALLDAAMYAGLPGREAERTTRSGLRSGMLRPRQIGGAA